MAKSLQKALGTTLDMAALADLIRSQGRGKDTILAHITPREAALLKSRGGRGSINPKTGLPEYEDEEAPTPVDTSAPPSPAPTPEVPVQQDQQTSTFDPFTYGGGFGGGQQPYRGDASVPTPLYASSIPQPTATFGATGGATIDTALPGPAATLEPPPDEEKKVSEKPTTGAPKVPGPPEGFNLGKALGLGTLAGLAGMNYGMSRQGASQAQAAQNQLQALATPYQQAGAQLINQAQTGVLTPANQQIVNAARAQAQQQVARTGGVGVAQAQNMVADLTAKLLANQYQLGLQVSQIGDSYAKGAITTGMQANQQLNAANQQFYSRLAQLAAPILTGMTPAQFGFGSGTSSLG